MNTQSLPKNYEIPTTKRAGEHFTPRRAHNTDEIERRRAQAGKNVLILEEQQKGIEIALDMLMAIEDPNERAIAAKIVGGALLSSAAYLFDADPYIRMRHTGKLPILADLEGWREDSEHYDRVKVEHGLVEAAQLSHHLAEVRRRELDIPKEHLVTARALASAGLNLAVWPLPPLSAHDKPKDIQLMVRESALDMQNASVALGEKVGTIPSVAQLADHLSPLSVELQRTAPAVVVDAYGLAVERLAA